MKKFYDELITKDHEALTSVRAILRSYGIQYRVRWGSTVCSAHPSWNGHGFIYLGFHRDSSKNTVRDFLSTVFHELAHIQAYQMGKYVHYHGPRPLEDVEVNILAIRTAIRAEKYVDRLARKLMKIYFPDIPYKIGYNQREIEWFRENWLADWKLRLAEHIAQRNK